MNVFPSRQRTLRERVEARRTQSNRYEADGYTLLNQTQLRPSAPPSGGVLAAHRTAYRSQQLTALLPPLIAFLVFAGVLAAFALLVKTTIKPEPEPAPQVVQAVLPTPEPTLPAIDPQVAARGPVRILILGSDQRPDDGGYRTDVVVLLTIDPRASRVSALSFPRDLIVNVPGYGDTRINTVMGISGFDGLTAALEQDFGVRPQYYFQTNFEGFIGLINSIGGINVTAEQPLEDSCDLPISRGGVCKIEPGQYLMDGDTALWYIRSRHTSSDFDRLRRAQEVMVGIFARFMEMQSLTRVPELYNQYRTDVETNMDAVQILGLMPVAARIVRDPARIERYTISPDMTSDWWMWDGAQVLLPDREAIRGLVEEAGFGKEVMINEE